MGQNLRRISKKTAVRVMGGFGSARRRDVRKLRVLAHAVTLRAGKLRRGGALRPDASGTLTWGDPERPPAGINFRSTGTRLAISYCSGEGDKARWIVEEIYLACVSASAAAAATDWCMRVNTKTPNARAAAL